MTAPASALGLQNSWRWPCRVKPPPSVAALQHNRWQAVHKRVKNAVISNG
jgi:hypothetical protein